MEGTSRYETVKLATQFWNKDSELTIIIAIAFFIGFIIFFIAGFFYQKYRKEKKVKDYFIHYALERDLNENQIKILWNYALKMGRDPMVVLEFKAPFEKVIDLYLKEHLDADEKLIQDMRKKLGFEIVSPYVPLVTTKDIELFQNATIIHNNRSYNATLYDKDERYMYWLLSSDSGPVNLNIGDTIKLIFIRKDDAIYTIILPIEDIQNDSNKILIKLSHTFEMTRTQRREYPRIHVEIPVEVIYYDKKEDKEYKLYGTIVDLSAGGSRICFENKPDILSRIKYSEVLKIKYQLLDNHLENDLKLLDKIEHSKNICIRGTFENMKEQTEQKIHEFVQKEQKKLALLKNAS